MYKIRLFINKLSKVQKITILVISFCVILFLTIGIPTMARYKNRNINTIAVWDGSTATSYRKGDGSQNNPYVISNGSELSYFKEQLNTNNYSDKYFVLSNDIVLNKGLLKYDNNKIIYILDGTTYYVKGNEYFDNEEYTGDVKGTLNTFDTLNNFKGTLDGNSYRIYGLYMTNESNIYLSLFNNLEGNIKNLYIENALVYGGNITALLSSNTNNATVENVLLDGYVISKEAVNQEQINNISSTSFDITSTKTINQINANTKMPYGSEIISSSIMGNYTLNNTSDINTSIKINDQQISGGTFDISLGAQLLSTINVETQSTDDNASVLLSNIQYKIVYKYTITSGVVAQSSNTTITNTVNKVNVYGSYISSGIVGITSNHTEINKSYNVGSINGQISGGLIAVVENDNSTVGIIKSYNNSEINGTEKAGLIAILKDNTGAISITNSFDTSVYALGNINNSTVNVNNSYYVNNMVNTGSITGTFTLTALTNLKTDSYVIDNLYFNKFINFDDLNNNTQNCWVYENGELPILYIDDEKNMLADINVNVYKWNNLSPYLSNIRLENNITFNITPIDELKPIKEAYYYITNSETPLTKTDLEAVNTWTSYNGVVQITEEGTYVIYAKVIDYDDNVYYINTDLLTLDLPGVNASISFDDNVYTELSSTLNNLYIDETKNISIKATDKTSSIVSIKYYVSSDVLTKENLDNLDASAWINYDNSFNYNYEGTNIIYAKIVDSFDYITYVNTDKITFAGYKLNSINAGINTTDYMDSVINISNTSTLNLNYIYDGSGADYNNYTHNLITNFLLPIGTKITLIDNIDNKVYFYKITTSEDIYGYSTSCSGGCIKKATYPLSLFKEVGNINSSNYVEKSYYNAGNYNENFKIILDFSNTNMVSNYTDLNIYMELHNQDGLNVRPTLKSDIKAFNIYSSLDDDDTKASLYLNTQTPISSINYYSDSSNVYNLNSGINYKTINGNRIIDTSYENKILGLSIKMVDSLGNTLSKDYLKNITFKIDGTNYYPGNDNIVRINLNKKLVDINSQLTILTTDNSSPLIDGTYYIKISNYAAYDGLYYDDIGNEDITIPIIISGSRVNIDYGFDVLMDDQNKIIDKNTSTGVVDFKILKRGNLKNPNIRVALYKKDTLSAYDQDYSLIDLQSYVTNDLNKYIDNIYYVTASPIEYNNYTKKYNEFSINLNLNNLENGGYKYVFGLYDGNTKIGTIDRYFIVK